MPQVQRASGIVALVDFIAIEVVEVVAGLRWAAVGAVAVMAAVDVAVVAVVATEALDARITAAAVSRSLKKCVSFESIISSSA
jgi:hypothetical protein